MADPASGPPADLAQLDRSRADLGQAIVDTLQERFRQGAYYTQAGTQRLLALSPHHADGLGDVPIGQMGPHHARFTPEAVCASPQALPAASPHAKALASALPPHPFVAATQAYVHMMETSNDQTLVMTGESGSAKSRVAREVVNHLIYLSSQLTGERVGIYREIAAVQEILECLGSARVPTNLNGSRHGTHWQLLWDEEFQLAGLLVQLMGLKTQRVMQVPEDERNFHVFHALMAGANSEEKSFWKLDEARWSACLTARSQSGDASNDAQRLARLKTAFRTCGFSRKTVSQIMQVVAAILHLGTFEFVTNHFAKDGSVMVKRRETLQFVAELLQVQDDVLETVVTTTTITTGSSAYTEYLSAGEAHAATRKLGEALYRAIVEWIFHEINNRLGSREAVAIINVVDFLGFENATPKNNGLEAFATNMAHEVLMHALHVKAPRDRRAMLVEEGVPVPATMGDGDSNTPESDALSDALVDLLVQREGGICRLVEEYTHKPKTSPETLLEVLLDRNRDDPLLSAGPAGWSRFVLNHHGEPITYDVSDWMQTNRIDLDPAYIELFGLNAATKSKSAVAFLTKVFRASQRTVPARGDGTIALQRKPTRKPSRKLGRTHTVTRQPSVARATAPTTGAAARGNGDADLDDLPLENLPSDAAPMTLLSLMHLQTGHLLDLVQDTRTWTIACFRANDDNKAGAFAAPCVHRQVNALHAVDLIRHHVAPEYANAPSIDAFVTYISEFFSPLEDESQLGTVQRFFEAQGWTAQHAALGTEHVFLTEPACLHAALVLDRQRREPRIISRAAAVAFTHNIFDGDSGQDEVVRDGFAAAAIEDGVGVGVGALGADAEVSDEAGKKDEDLPVTSKKERKLAKQKAKDEAKAAKAAAKKGQEPMTKARKWWLRFTTFHTWFIPDVALERIGGMKPPDVKQAWREKFALCCIVLWLSGVMLFFVQLLGLILCPRTRLFSPDALSGFNKLSGKSVYIGFNGIVYDATRFINSHPLPSSTIIPLLGTDASAWFPTVDASTGQWWPSCYTVTGANPAEAQPLTNVSCTSSPNIDGHCHNTWAIDRSINLFNDINVWRVGYLTYPDDTLYSHNTAADGWILVNGRYYNMTRVMADGNRLGIIDDTAYDTIQYYLGRDATHVADTLKPYMDCFDHMFFVGMKNEPGSVVRCQVSTIILYTCTGVIVGIMVIKFLAALQFTKKRLPEKFDRFVILQVPCYTEGEASLRKTIDSLALLDYDDTRKLLFLIADGMVKGAGNDLPTPDLVLKILGVNPEAISAEAYSYVSIGEGSKQHNKAKVYSGLYSIQARYIPFLVVVKCGKETETSRAGNRGKRDSQIIIMRFLNRVHYQAPMNPLELEMYHHMKNIIGVDPYLYEYTLMVDADTEVEADSLNRLIAVMVTDGKIMGLCGETKIRNERSSWVTMLQVFEYYISQNCTKAFESLFGNVTCLPGCFCMYRIRSPEKKIPLLIASDVIAQYEENKVDTLHKKNLLSLGEDRYLTTLMLKTFPEYRNKFTGDALCYTIVPDQFAVLLSQRRRWINSTVHNLFELLFLPELCGCLLFSMRTVVFMDLFATLIMPAVTCYLVYLIYNVAAAGEVATITVIMICASYGLQAIIFLLKRQWQHIGWLVVSILALPVFSFWLPLYAYWHFDDFSWGNTRKIAGASSGGHEGDTDVFDVSSIPLAIPKEWAKPTASTKKLTGSDWSGSHYGDIQASSYIAGQRPYAESMTHRSDRDYNARPDSMIQGSPSAAMGVGHVGGSYIGDGMPYANPTTGYPPSHAQEPPMQVAGSTNAPWKGGVPSDEELHIEIQHIIGSFPLEMLTKKKVRDALELYFDQDLSDRKPFIDQCILDAVNNY